MLFKVYHNKRNNQLYITLQRKKLELLKNKRIRFIDLEVKGVKE